MGSISQQQPRIIAYWIGWQNLDFNPGNPVIPAYVKDIDVLILAFALVKNGDIEYTCASNETCVCNGSQYWSQEQVMAWVKNIRTAYPNIKVLLSVGGWAYNDWQTVTNANTFAANVVNSLSSWENTFDGLDIDYETGDGSLPPNVNFCDVMQALVGEMEARLPGNPVLSFPYYGGSPFSLDSLAGLTGSITFAATMGYGDDTGDYQALLAAGFRAANGFSNTMMPPGQIASFVDQNNIKAAMFWNLCDPSEGPPAGFIVALNESLPASGG